MIKLIAGPKGVGKTKIIIDEANKLVEGAKGHVVYITDSKRYFINLNFDIRCIDVKDYELESEESFTGFLKGIVAGNTDMEFLFIDGIARITNRNLSELETFFKTIETLADEVGFTVVFTISSEIDSMPRYLSKYTRIN